MPYVLSIGMLQVRQYLRADATCPFAESFVALRDGAAKARIDTAVRKLGRGLKPDVKAVGEGGMKPASTTARATGCISAMMGMP